MKILKINNYEVLIDEEDYELINKVKWYIVKGNTNYAYTDLRERKNGQVIGGAQIAMHRAILGLNASPKEKGDYIDHINGNGLDNRKQNLRIVSNQYNTFNTPAKHKNKSSVYKGVMKARKKWNVQIKLDYKSNNLGTYSDEKYAAKVYDAVVRFYTGDVGFTNFKEVFLEPMSIETAKSYKHKILINESQTWI